MDSFAILIVGDDKQSCTYLANILSAKNWRTDIAWIGSKALELARNLEYHAVVFDYRQPGRDGAEVCHLIQEAQPNAHRIFMTGTPTIESVYRAVEAGAERVLAKPVDPSELVQVLEDALTAPAQ